MAVLNLDRRELAAPRVPLPPLPPREAGLLVAVEAAAGQRTAAAWRLVAAELQHEGVRPVAADLARLEAQAAAGQRAVEAVWAQQRHLERVGAEEAADKERVHLTRAVTQSRNAGLAAATAPHGKLSIEQRQRGRALKKAMLSQSSRAELTPLELDAIAEAQRTQARAPPARRAPPPPPPPTPADRAPLAPPPPPPELLRSRA